MGRVRSIPVVDVEDTDGRIRRSDRRPSYRSIMSQTPGIGSSREDRPTSEYIPASSSSASPFGAVVQETVLNPEGRRLSTSPDSSFQAGSGFADAVPVD